MNPIYKPLVYQQIPSNFSNYSLSKDSTNIANKGPVFVSSSRLQHINCVVQPTQQLGGIYLGDIVCLLKTEILQSNKIRSVLTCMIQPISTLPHHLVQNHKILYIKDSLEYPIFNHFQQTYDFIHKMRKQKKNVLVHCHAGVSRSATILCAYLMKQNNWDPYFTLNYVKLKRQRAKPNLNFFKQLKYYYNQIVSLRKLPSSLKNNQNIHIKTENKANQNNILQKRQQKKQDTTRQTIHLQQQIQYHSELVDLQEKNKRINKIGGRKTKIPFKQNIESEDNKRQIQFQNKQMKLGNKDNYTTRSQVKPNSRYSNQSLTDNFHNNISNLNKSLYSPVINFTNSNVKPKEPQISYQMGSYSYNLQKILDVNRNQQKKIMIRNSLPGSNGSKCVKVQDQYTKLMNQYQVPTHQHKNQNIKMQNEYNTPQKQKHLNIQRRQIKTQQTDKRQSQRFYNQYLYRKN